MNDRWLSGVEISEYLGITKDSVYKWAKEKGIPAHRLGRLWKFKTDEVDVWMRQGGAIEVKSGSKSNINLEIQSCRISPARVWNRCIESVELVHLSDISPHNGLPYRVAATT